MILFKDIHRLLIACCSLWDVCGVMLETCMSLRREKKDEMAYFGVCDLLKIYISKLNLLYLEIYKSASVKIEIDFLKSFYYILYLQE